MASPRIYLDYNATAPVRPEAREAALAAIDAAGNASSVHAEGRDARRRIEAARRQVATLVGVASDTVVFTSGGTEAAHQALAPIGSASRLDRLLVCASEHVAVLRGHRFPADRVEIVPVDPQGRVRLDRLESLLGAGPAVLALQAANNETGVLQDVRAAAALMHDAGGLVVCDAVQAAGRVDCRAEALEADIVLLSGHKLGGLQGAGALVVVNAEAAPQPLQRGGGQERGLRGGTESVPAIAAFGAAAACVADRPDAERLRGLRDRFERELAGLVSEAVVFGCEAARLPNTSCFAVRGLEAERLMMALDLRGIAVSSGSACSSGKVGRSHVLESMGVEGDLRQAAIRVSFGWGSVQADVDRIIEALGIAVATMRRRPLVAAA